MGLSTVGLAQLKEIALQQKAAPLMIVFFTDCTEKYGYVRDIGPTSFVLEEIQVVMMEKKDPNGQTGGTERHIQKVGTVTFPLSNLLNWAVLPPSALTSPSKVVLLRKSLKADEPSTC